MCRKLRTLFQMCTKSLMSLPRLRVLPSRSPSKVTNINVNVCSNYSFFHIYIYICVETFTATKLNKVSSHCCLPKNTIFIFLLFVLYLFTCFICCAFYFVFCAFTLFCVLFLFMYIVVSRVPKFTDQCHRVKIHLQLINIIYILTY
jgi:hypothetical protein